MSAMPPAESPSSLYRHAVAACWYLVCLLWGVSSGSVTMAAEVNKSSFPLELNVRLVWGGPRPLNYAGAMEIDDGKLTCLQQLGIDPFDAGFLVAEPNGKLAFDDSQTRFGGCDLRVLGKPNSRLKLLVNVQDPRTHQTTIKEYSWLISELRDSSSTESIEVGDCKVSIDRVPGDRLRVVTNRNHLIYNADESLGFQLQPSALPWANAVAQLQWTLVRAEDGHEVATQSRTVNLDEQGNGEPVLIPFSAPKEEGVYELHCKIEPKRMLPGLILRHPLVERSVQFVVYNNPPSQPSLSPRNGFSNTASSPQGWQTIAMPATSNFTMESLTHHLLESEESGRRYPFIDMAKSLSRSRRELTNAASNTNLTSALSIPVHSIASTTCQGLVPQEMHRILIRSASKSASLRVVVEGQAAPREKKVNESPWVNEILESSPLRTVHRTLVSPNDLEGETFEILFWPNARSCKVQISNLSTVTNLEDVDVQIDRWLPATASAQDANFKTQAVSTGSPSTLELHSPNVRSAYGQFLKSIGVKHNTFDDWRQFLHYAESTAQYCKAQGLERLAMVVASEGGTLYPSSKLVGNARFDTGTFSQDGRDILRKDVVELLYRVMARHHIEFVPMLELNGPIRDLAEGASQPDEAELWQDREGQSFQSGVGPRLYNPLSYRVQRSIASVLDEFQSRYQSNPNYRGLALRIDFASHLLVAKEIAATNRTILDRFVNEAGGNIPRDPAQRDSFIAQHANSMYQHWLQSASLSFLSKLKNKPRWISMSKGVQGTIESNNGLVFVAPWLVDGDRPDMQTTLGSILSQWSTESPTPIYLGMEQPEQRVCRELAELCRLASTFCAGTTQALPQRDAASSLSKVRVWMADENCSKLLISNSGALPERIQIVWESLPRGYQLSTTWSPRFSESNKPIEEMEATTEWRVTIPAGQAIEVALEGSRSGAYGQVTRPLHWYSQDTSLIRSLDVALQSLEQSVNRLSTPQPRGDFSANPSFESESPNLRGRFTGWTSSLDPHAAVSLDTNVSADGRNSIKFKSEKQSSVAWLQSDPFAISQTDRLHVGFQVSSDRVPDQVNVSLSRYDAKSERFESIASRAIGGRIVPAQGSANWTHLGFDLTDELRDRFERGEPMLCRLQIETKGEGTLWLDDVVVSTDFLREDERRDIRSELFLARGSLKSGDTGPANAMLSSPRARLVRWSDESYMPRAKLISTESTTGSKGTGASAAKPFGTPTSNGGQDKTETKPRLKRSRYFWWRQ